MANITPPLLSSIRPDFDDLVVELQNALTQFSSWQALLATETGSILIEYIAAIGAFLKDGIQGAYEESFTDTAKLDSSLRGIARTLGVRLSRKTPATCQVTLTNSNPSTGVVSNITITNAGSGYSLPPSVMFSGGGGTGATAVSVLGTGTQAGEVVQIIITNGGTGYLTAPTVNISSAGSIIPATATATINPAASYTIPAYSQFVSNSVNLFNRTAIIFPANQSQVTGVILYEGQINTATYIGTGLPFQIIQVSQPGFVISDQDVLVNDNNQALTVVTDGTWHYPNLAAYVSAINVTNGGSGYTSAPSVIISGGGGNGASATAVLGTGGTAGQVISVTITSAGQGFTSAPSISFQGGGGTGAIATATITNFSTSTNDVAQDLTLSTGELNLQFGNALFGFVPQNNDSIVVTYVITQGASGNNSNFGGMSISLPINSSITGTATTPLINGADEVPAQQYRIAPLIFSGYSRAVSISDLNAIALQYPGIADAQFLGQANVAPTVASYSNLVFVSLLGYNAQLFSPTQFAAFITWLTPKALPVTFVQSNPIAVPVTVNVTVFCKSTADLPTVQAEVSTAVNSIFTPGANYIGRNITESDIYNTILNTDPVNIDYITLTNPTSDIICSFAPPSNIVLNPTTGGSLAAATYIYVVTTLTSVGETFSSPIQSVIVGSPNNAVTISWNAVQGATGYNVYGRSYNSVYQLTATLGSAATSYTDNGGAFYTVPSTTWAANTNYSIGKYIVPSPTNGFYYDCIVGGTSGNAQPSFNTTIGSITADGTTQWENVGANPWKPSPLISTAGIFYASLSNLTINMAYSARRT